MATDTQEFVNKYIERQQRAIADLMNKVVLLETQLVIAETKITALQAEISKEGDGFSQAEMKEIEENDGDSNSIKEE